MDTSRERELRTEAERFRSAIIECSGANLVTVEDFPRGACGDASLLLGQWLHDNDRGDWEYVSGVRSTANHSHAWIQQDDLIVDITADQFAGIDDPVVVTQDHAWHSQFAEQNLMRPSSRSMTPKLETL